MGQRLESTAMHATDLLRPVSTLSCTKKPVRCFCSRCTKWLLLLLYTVPRLLSLER